MQILLCDKNATSLCSKNISTLLEIALLELASVRYFFALGEEPYILRVKEKYSVSKNPVSENYVSWNPHSGNCISLGILGFCEDSPHLQSWAYKRKIALNNSSSYISGNGVIWNRVIVETALVGGIFSITTF